MRLQIGLLTFGSALLLSTAALAQEAAENPEYAGPTIAVPLDEYARKFVEGANAFTLDLFKAIGEPESNLIVSPASVSAAVGFAYRGAAGETASQLKQVMRFPFDPVQNLKASGAVLDTMTFSASGREIHTANSLWLQSGMPFNEEFERDMATYAKAGLNRIDFKADPEAARQSINTWVSDATRANISEILKEGIITEGTRAALVNAIWFNADWQAPFNIEPTRSGPFTSVDGSKSPQLFMNMRAQFKALKRGGTSAIQMPYKGGEFALVALLPNNYNKLPEFESELNETELSRWLAELDSAEFRETVLMLPKFKLSSSRDLAETVSGMGAPLAFSDDADFSGMATPPYPGGSPEEKGLEISSIIHEATIDVNELGTEASAATALAIQVTGALRPASPPFIFRADKPFLFALRDLRTGLLLFMGRYVRPEPIEG